MTDERFEEIMIAADPVSRKVTFFVPGQPVAKGRPKFARRGNFVSTYTPRKTADYEALIRAMACEVMVADPRLCMGPLRASFEVRLVVPTSWSKKRREAAIWPTTKTDIDNYVKCALDGMNGYVYADDSQVVELFARKVYAEEAGLLVTVEEIL